MKIEDQLRKATAESEYWFGLFSEKMEQLKLTTDKLFAADAVAEEFMERSRSQEVRLGLICDIQRAMWKTGAPIDSWLLGGVIEEKLREILNEATQYEAPEIITDAKLNLVRPRSRFTVSPAAEDYIINLEKTVKNLMAALQKQEVKK